MTDMQTSLPLLIVWLSILNPVINFSTHLWPVKWNDLQIYLCLAHSISSPLMLMQHMHQPWSTIDMIHFISSHDHIGSSILTLLAFHHCLGPLAPSPRLALHSCNRSIKPSLVSIFSTLVTWLHVMSHMQWASSLHIRLWTNLLCISHLNTLVHLGCHSITKTKQGPFNDELWFLLVLNLSFLISFF